MVTPSFDSLEASSDVNWVLVPPPDPATGVEEAAGGDEAGTEVGAAVTTAVVGSGALPCATAGVGWPQVWPELYV